MLCLCFLKQIKCTFFQQTPLPELNPNALIVGSDYEEIVPLKSVNEMSMIETFSLTKAMDDLPQGFFGHDFVSTF